MIEVIRGIHSSTPLSCAFFANDNIEKIHQMIRYLVWKSTNEIIDKQSTDALLVIMRSVYLQYGRNQPCNIEQQTEELNVHTVKALLPNLITELKQHVSYREEIVSVRTLPDHPMNTNIRATKTLERNPW